MKSLAALVAGLSLTCSMAGSVMAAETDTDGGAKGLFYEQLSHPTDAINTGIQYWIELHHDGQTIHATNKTAFHTGDKIRFHVRPNIDGYAYIMLRSGSRGEQAVLFPEQDRTEDNKIQRGKEMVLPKEGMIGFDENPGVEKLTLLVSRTPIDTDSYLSGNSKDGAPRMVAMSSSGSKDLVPNQVLVSYLPPTATTSVPEQVKVAAARQAVTTTKTTKGTTTTTTVKTTKSNPAPLSDPSTRPPKYNHKLAGGNTGKTKHTLAVETKNEDTISVVHAADNDSPLKSGLVTVVYKNPNGVLAAELSLEHKE